MLSLAPPVWASEEPAPHLAIQNSLKQLYEHFCREASSINEHLPVLRELAQQCTSVVEIGVLCMTSTWGSLYGLSENSSPARSYLGIDLVSPPSHILTRAKYLAEAHGISFQFWQANDRDVDIEPADMLFIDSLHTYCHLTYELEKFSSKIRKFIALHDTSAPWGFCDDSAYKGNYSEYPASIDRTKRGLWPAVEDFLARHPEWTLSERRLNNNGFTVLRRVGDQ